MNKSQFGAFCWYELATTNTQTAKDFYGKLLGWKFTDHEMGDTTYTMIECEGEKFGGMWHIPNEQKDQIPPHWLGYILVNDVAETVEQARSMGATVKMPPTAAGDFGRFAIIMDPTGAHIAFWQSIEK